MIACPLVIDKLWDLYLIAFFGTKLWLSLNNLVHGWMGLNLMKRVYPMQRDKLKMEFSLEVPIFSYYSIGTSYKLPQIIKAYCAQ